MANEPSPATPGSLSPGNSHAMTMLDKYRINWRLTAALMAVSVLGLFTLPPLMVFALIEVMIFALFASALNLWLSYAGILSFGHAGYFGLGAYGVAITIERFGWPMPLGILAGNQVYFLISALLIATASAIDTTSFYWIRIAGALWLAGLMLAPLWRRARPGQKVEMERHPPGPAGAGTFLTGILLQLANPKTIVFFVAFLPQFIDPRASLAVQFSILAVSSFAIEYAILTGYGLLAVKPKAWLGGAAPGSRMKLAGQLGLALAVGWWIFRG